MNFAKNLGYKLLLFINVVGIAFLLFYNEEFYATFHLAFDAALIFITATFFYAVSRKSASAAAERVADKLKFYFAEILKNQKTDMAKIIYDDDISKFRQTFEDVNSWIAEREYFNSAALDLINSVALDINIEKMLDNILPKLIEYTNSSCGAFYLINKATSRMEIKSSIGFNKNIYSEFDATIGEGFFGYSMSDPNMKIVTDIPYDSIYLIRTFLGKAKPKSVIIAPIPNNDEIVGILVIASVSSYTKIHESILNILRTYIGAAVNNALTFERTKRLSNELKFQNRLIQDLNDDLEKKVQNRTVFLNSIIDSIEDYAIYAADKDLRLSAWNKGAEKILGYASEEVVGKDIDILNEDKTQNIIRQNLDALTRSGKIRTHGWRYKKDGAKYYADTTVFRMDNDSGDAIGYTNVTRDITQLRNTEEALWLERDLTEKILNSSSRSLVVCDADGFIELFNVNSARVLNEKDLKDKNICDYFEEEERLLDILKFVYYIRVHNCVFKI